MYWIGMHERSAQVATKGVESKWCRRQYSLTKIRRCLIDSKRAYDDAEVETNIARQGSQAEPG